MGMCDSKYPPILRHKDLEQLSVFTPQNLLREAKRQKAIADKKVPRICILDPDGGRNGSRSLIRFLRSEEYARNLFRSGDESNGKYRRGFRKRSE